MRTLRLSLVGTLVLALLGGLGAAVVAQDEAEEPTAVTVTATQECVGHNPCLWTASDPRLPGTLDTEMFTGSVEVEGVGFLDAGFAWLDVSSEGPEGGWTGHVYALWGEPTQNFLVLSGTGTNEGWHYIASGTDPEPDGDFDWTGTLYEGELPPFPPEYDAKAPSASTAVDAVPVAGSDGYPSLLHAYSEEQVEDVMHIRGGILTMPSTMDDPRVSGQVTFAFSVDVLGDAATEWGTMRIENVGGAWEGPCSGGAWNDGNAAIGSCWLTGAGTYEGYTYYRQHVWGPGASLPSTHGIIFSGVPPVEFPELPAIAGESVEAGPTATPAETIGLPADDGARILEVEQLDERTVDLTIDSPAVGTQQVRLLLPAGFDPDAEVVWPVLYLLHGGGNSYVNWTLETDVEELTADLPLLVLMPEAGAVAAHSDWWNGGEGGPPMWETFHLTELRELLERNWQAGDDRVVAGYSMGGLGAMSYAARHPGLFKAAASFTGVLNPLTATLPFPLDLWGDRTEQADIWEAHDPVFLAPALEGIPLYVSYGNGEPGPLDADDAEFDELEASLAEMNEAFVARLEELGIPATVDAYGPGTHSMPYVERGLHEAMPMLLEALGM